MKNVTLLPLVGALHLRYPAYNAVTVRDALMASQPQAIAITALGPGSLEKPDWQDTEEIVLPLAVIPWARQQGLAIHPIMAASPDASAAADFRRFAAEYPQIAQRLTEADSHLRPVQELLGQALNLERLQTEVLPLLQRYQQRREELLEDGPATDWLHMRCTQMAEQVLKLPQQRITVLCSLEHQPFLAEFLAAHCQLLPTPKPALSEESRERSLLDLAFQTDVPEPGNVIAQLRKIAKVEARYHEANLLLANGHLIEALELLEQVSKEDFREPYYLPGFLLARLGQLYDLSQNRSAALRSYRGVLALSYAPAAAKQAAQQGLSIPFGQPETHESDG